MYGFIGRRKAGHRGSRGPGGTVCRLGFGWSESIAIAAAQLPSGWGCSHPLHASAASRGFVYSKEEVEWMQDELLRFKKMVPQAWCSAV